MGSWRTSWHFAAIAGAGLVGALSVLVATRAWGLGVSYDSVAYVQASHHLSVDLPQPRDLGGQPLYWWGPIYPLVLRAAGSSYSHARLVNAGLLLVGAAVVGAVARRAISNRAGVVAAAAYALSPVVVAAHLDLLAEPLFLIFATASLGLIAASRPTLAGLATGAALLTRYAGLPLLLVGVFAFRGRDRLRFGLTSVGIYGAWLLRNQLVAGKATGRELRWHPVSWGALSDAAASVAHVIVTPGRLPSLSMHSVDPGLALQLLVVAALAIGLARVDTRNVPRLVTVSLAYGVVYLAFLVVTVSLFDAATPINDRLLVPLGPAVAFAVAWVTARTPILAAVVICCFALATAQHVRTVSLYGLDYSGRIWEPARLDGLRLPHRVLYSNWPGAVAYFGGRSPRRIPAERDPHTLDSNPAFAAQTKQVVAGVRAGTAAVIVLDDPKFLQTPRLDPGTRRVLAGLRGSCQRLRKVVILCE